MEPFNKHQDNTKKTTSPLLLHTEKQQQQQQQQQSPIVESIQDTNYIGITINDDVPRQTYTNGLTRHQSLNDYSTINKQIFHHSRNSSIPFDTSPITTATTTTTKTTNTIDSPPIYHQHHSPRFNQIIEEEEAEDYMIQPELSGAFRKIKNQADLPMSHHRRAREGKRYGVIKMEYLIYSFINLIVIATLYAYNRIKSDISNMQ